jgi:riboflavin kinase/FMN adenylyltransferase
MDFQRSIYGQTLGVQFVQRLRSERKFASVDELKARIGEDVRLGRMILASPDALPQQRPQGDPEDD